MKLTFLAHSKSVLGSIKISPELPPITTNLAQIHTLHGESFARAGLSISKDGAIESLKGSVDQRPYGAVKDIFLRRPTTPVKQPR